MADDLAEALVDELGPELASTIGQRLVELYQATAWCRRCRFRLIDSVWSADTTMTLGQFRGDIVSHHVHGHPEETQPTVTPPG